MQPDPHNTVNSAWRIRYEEQGARISGRAQCRLVNEWQSWSADKQQDRLFMVCPACGQFGSHVQTRGAR